MQCTNIYTAFNQSLRWNAGYYFLYKTLCITVSFLLFNRLSVNDFSVWANINSFIFLLLLWLDCGLRKSIPRYCHEFEQKGSLNMFLSCVLIAQAIILIVALPLFLGLITFFFRSLSLSYHPALLYCGAIIFLIEGINSSIKLFYHAHFWNKTYTIIQSGILLLEMIINIVSIATFTRAIHLLFALFITKLIASSMNAFIGFFILKQRYNAKVKLIQQKEKGATKSTIKMFMHHSIMMWFSTTIKSLTERNFLVPLLTYCLGSAQANLFKVGNDWAMLIHRPIIKTIGSSDITLLSYLETNDKTTSSMLQKCSQLLKKIALICLPFFGVLLCVTYFMRHSTLITLFFIIGLGHMIETILSPYERILEVKHNYKLLIFSYAPYLAMLIFLASYLVLSSINIVTLLLFVHSIRIICSLLMVYHSHKAYLGFASSMVDALKVHLLVVRKNCSSTKQCQKSL